MSAHQHQQHHGFDVLDPFRKFPLSVNVAAAATVEFNDELSMAPPLGGPGDRSLPDDHHHVHHGHDYTHHSQQQQQQYEDPAAYEDGTHNIFDVSASSASSTAFSEFQHTFPLPPPPPMEKEQGVSQVTYTTLISNTHSSLLSWR